MNFEEHEIIELYEKKVKKSKEYFNKCNHYNKINKTNKTRMSIDFRIIPFSKFKKSNKLSVTNNKKFTIGDYYIVV